LSVWRSLITALVEHPVITTPVISAKIMFREFIREFINDEYRAFIDSQ
jgi:hypothetical protein